MANGLSDLKNNHQYLTGGMLVLVGLIGLFGSFTGTLAPILAALFDPADLRNTKNAVTLVGVADSNTRTGETVPGENTTPSTAPQLTRGYDYTIPATTAPEVSGGAALPPAGA